jgi:hypothetical protein
MKLRPSKTQFHLSRNLLSCIQVTYHNLISGISKRQQAESSTLVPTFYTSSIDPHKRSPTSLCFSTIAAKHGCALAFEQLSIAQATPFCFHLPLHRFLAACLRELCLREKNSLQDLLDMILLNIFHLRTRHVVPRLDGISHSRPYRSKFEPVFGEVMDTGSVIKY